MNLTAHFTEAELNCRCNSCANKPLREEIRKKLLRVADCMEVVRRVVDRPVTITSALRCEKHNLSIGGVVSSQHLHGLAVDFRVSGWNGESLASLLKDLIKHGLLPDGGIGVYKDRPRIVHYDLGKPRRWRE